MSTNASVFGEYRFSHAGSDPAAGIRATDPLNAHDFRYGLSIRF
jgi:hypothetical protein